MAGETRVLKFAEGVNTGAPTTTFLQTTEFAQFANDAAYVTSKGSAATDGDAYYNTTDDVIRVYANGAWVSVSTSTDLAGYVDKTTSESVGGVKTFTSNMIISDTTSSSDKDSGALVIEGGLGVEENVHIGGDLTVSGTSTSLDDLVVTDETITVNNTGTQAAADAGDAGLIVSMSDATNATLHYDSTAATKFKSGEVGSTVGLVDESTAQSVSNKSIETPSRLDVKQDTFANLTTYAGSASNGQLCFATDTKLMYQVVDSALVAVGSGGGGGGSLNFYEDGEADNAVIGSFTEGSSAIFGDSGTSNSTFAISATSPLRGSKSYTLTLNATPGTSNDDWVASSTIDIPLGYRGRTLGFKVGSYQYDGADSDILWAVRDETGSTILTQGTEYFNTASGNKELIFSIFVPDSITQLKIGPHVQTHATGSEVLKWDDVVVTPDPFVFKDLLQRQELILDTANGFGSTNTVIRRFTNEQKNEGGSLLTYVDSSTDGASITANQDCTVSISYTEVSSSVMGFGISLNSTQLTTPLASINQADRKSIEATGSSNTNSNVSTVIELKKGDVIRPHTGGTGLGANAGLVRLHLIAEADSENVVTPLRSVQPVKYRETASQSIPENTVTVINFTEKAYDNDSLVSTGVAWKYTVPENGIYEIDVFARFVGSSAWSANEAAQLFVYVNGSEASRLEHKAVGASWTASNTMAVQGSDALSLVKGDEVNIRILHNIGGGVPLALFGSSTNGSRVAIKKIDQNATLGYIPFTEYQIKALSANITSASSDVTDLKFSNLEVGRNYRYTLQVFTADTDAAQSDYGMIISHNGSTKARYTFRGSGNTDNNCCTISAVFTAETSTVTVATTGTINANQFILGNGSQTETFGMLEALPMHREVSKY